MSLRKRLPVLLSLHPLPQGEPSPDLSLTAEEGTWIKLADFRGQLQVVLVFFRSLRDDATDLFLKALQQERRRFEAVDTVIFGVSQFRTDRLREYRSRHGLEFHLLYDPLGIQARSFGCSGRIRPNCKPSVVVIDKEGRIAHSQRGYPTATDLLSQVAGLAGVSVPEPEQERRFSGVRDPGAPIDDVREISIARARALLGETDSHYILLDVRTAAEFASFHVPGARNIALDELPHRYQELGQLTHILCVGQTGGLAAAAAEFLTSVGGSTIYSVDESVSNWPAPE